MDPRIASNIRAQLGEGPTWDARAGILYWVDIKAGHIFAHRPDSTVDEIIGSGESVSSVVPRSKGGLALTLKHGYFSYDLGTGKLEALSEPIEADMPRSRFNDGKCDPAGRYWAGTMDDLEIESFGSLYVLEKDRRLKKVVSGVAISNGMGWSPDNKTMYYIDSPTKKVWSFDYSVQSGEISNKRTAVDFEETHQPGIPDGMAVDAEGMIWVAHWGGARVTRWRPTDGKLLETLPIPADEPTSCCFGGKNLDELYITSAREGLDEKTLSSQPLAGSLFVADVGVKGLPTYSYEG